MKLYYSAGSCSTSCHIVLEESGLKYEAIAVDFDRESDPNLVRAMKLNPMGTVPVLETDDGHVLTQNIAIHAAIADRVPNRSLLPESGTAERAEALNALSFVAADLHKSFSPLFALKGFPATVRPHLREMGLKNVEHCLKVLDGMLDGKDYLLGASFTTADAYAFVVLGWTDFLEVPTTGYRNLGAYRQRVAARPAVRRVLEAEGLLDG